MTADKSGITVRENTVRWLTLVIGLAALVGPFATFFVTTSVDRAREDEKWKAQAVLNARVQGDIDLLRSDAATDRKEIGQRLLNIEQLLYRLQGSLERRGMVPQTNSSAFANVGP